MNLQEFTASVGNDQPIQGISPALHALWHQAKGDWDAAHHLAQSDKSPMGSWIITPLSATSGLKR